MGCWFGTRRPWTPCVAAASGAAHYAPMTGIDLLATLRSRGDATPFCFVTSEGSDEMREQAAAAGAFAVIGKPFTVEAFLDVLSPVVPS